MASALHAAIERRLGSAVVNGSRIIGGDVDDAARVQLADGRKLFVKTHARPPHGMYGCEAEGLRWMAEANALPIAQVLAVSDGEDGEPAFIALALIESASRARDYE